MKAKLLSMLLVFSMILAMLAACNTDKPVVDPVIDDPDGENEVVETVIPDSCDTISHVLMSSTQKILPDTVYERSADADNTVYLAKNEYEACQLVLRTENENVSVYIETTGFTDSNGAVLSSDLFTEQYIALVSDKDYGTYPDALIPLGSEAVNMVAGENLPIYIRLNSDDQTVAGDYSCEIVIRDASTGDALFKTTVNAHVWDFTLPESPTCKTAFGIHTNSVFSKYDSSEAASIYGLYYNYLLDHKLTPYWMNALILSDEGSAQMSDPARTSFIIPYYYDDADAVAQFEKVASNPEWLEKSFFYVVDEPGDAAAYDQIKSLGKNFKKICPGYNMITPFNSETVTVNGTEKSTVNLLELYSNILCPLSSLFSSKSFVKEIDEARGYGNRIWWYVCSAPAEKYCNFLIYQDALCPRILFWQQKDLDIEGFLYWETTYWAECGDPWTNPLTTPSTGMTSFGDGSLFYPGEDGPISTLRLEAITDGVEDFEYLTIAEEMFGSEYVDGVIDQVTTSLTKYTRDPDVFGEVRRVLGMKIAGETVQE